MEKLELNVVVASSQLDFGVDARLDVMVEFAGIDAQRSRPWDAQQFFRGRLY
ncbi:hypothetical protein [Paraherbaspirillum soli]|uniref:Uncharacterized protein n=1 Tax=Paraherbaspirillum soli TaxID=631222 RepID=A0ABW0M9T2_9BURK